MPAPRDGIASRHEPPGLHKNDLRPGGAPHAHTGHDIQHIAPVHGFCGYGLSPLMTQAHFLAAFLISDYYNAGVNGVKRDREIDNFPLKNDD
jgi:hypothetical protein